MGTFHPKSELWALSWRKMNVWILCLIFRLFNHCCDIYGPVYEAVHGSPASQCHTRFWDLACSSLLHKMENCCSAGQPTAQREIITVLGLAPGC